MASPASAPAQQEESGRASGKALGLARIPAPVSPSSSWQAESRDVDQEQSAPMSLQRFHSARSEASNSSPAGQIFERSASMPDTLSRCLSQEIEDFDEDPQEVDKVRSDTERKGGRLIEIRRVDIYRLVRINDAAGTFSGQIYVEMVLPGKGKDADLTKLHPKFPNLTAYFPFEDPDQGGDPRKPTFKPNAEWFLAQFQFDNIVTGACTRDAKVQVKGDDIVFQLYVEGDVRAAAVHPASLAMIV